MGRLCFCRRSFIALGVSEGKAQFAHNTGSLRAILLLMLQTCNHIGSFNVILPKHPNSVQCRLLPSHGSGLLTEFRLNSRNYEGTKFGEEIGPLRFFLTLSPDTFSRIRNWNDEISSLHFLLSANKTRDLWDLSQIQYGLQWLSHVLASVCYIH